MVTHFFVWDLRVVPDSLAPSNCHTPSFQNRVTTSRRGKSPLSHWSQSCKTAKKSECCLTFFCLSCLLENVSVPAVGTSSNFALYVKQSIFTPPSLSRSACSLVTVQLFGIHFTATCSSTGHPRHDDPVDKTVASGRRTM